jgi:hypothetical protein
MLRRRPGHTAHDDDGNGKFKSTGSPSSQQESSSSIVSNITLMCVVIFFITAGFLQHYYDESRSQAHLPGTAANLNHYKKVVKQPFFSKKRGYKQSMLTPEQDAALELDKEDRRYHTVFSTDCSPYQHWQSYLVFFSAMKMHQTGFVTRIASGCDAEQADAMQEWFKSDIQFMSKRFRLQLTPHFSGIKNEAGETVGDYKFFNKPFGVLYWMENSPALQYHNDTYGFFPSGTIKDVVIIIDPDMALMRPITGDFSDDRETVISGRRKDKILARKVASGQPFAQVYGFGAQWARLDLEKICGPGTPAAKVDQADGFRHYPAGPPYIGTVADMYQIALHWTKFVPGVYEQYPHLLAEMFAFSIAAAHLKMPFQLIDSLMISKVDVGGEGWPLVDQIPAEEVCAFAKDPVHSQHAVPSVVHMCQRYAVGSEWFFTKRKIPSDIYDCDTPLFAEPPDDLAMTTHYRWPPGGHKQDMTVQETVRESFMICYIYSLMNQAAAFYKQNACSSGGINLAKTRNLVQYMADKNKKKEAE